MNIKRETADHSLCILSCLSDHLKYPVGHLVHLVSTVDGGTVTSSLSFLCLISQHLSSVLRDWDSSEDDITVLLPVDSSVISKMIEFISIGNVNVDTIDDVFELGKLVQMMGIGTGNIEVKDVKENGVLDVKIGSVSHCKVKMNKRRIQEMMKVNGKWICQLCQKGFFKKNRCLDHLVKKHKLDSVPSAFSCDLCKVGYNNKCDLRAHHMGKRHKKKLTETYKRDVGVLATIGVSRGSRYEAPKEMMIIDGRWQCQLCGDKFKQKCTCLRHLVINHSIKIPFKYVCKPCNKGFFRKYTMDSHKEGKKHKYRSRTFKTDKDMDSYYVTLEDFLAENVGNIYLKGQKASSITKEPRSGYGKRLFVDGKWVCKICGANFEGIGECNEHLDKIHKVKVAKQTCEMCQLTFYKEPKKFLQTHLRSKKHFLRMQENVSDTRSQNAAEEGKYCKFDQNMANVKKGAGAILSHKKRFGNKGISREKDTNIKEVKNESENSTVTISDVSVSPPASFSHIFDIKMSACMTNIYGEASEKKNQQDNLYLDSIKKETISLCGANSLITKVLLPKESELQTNHVAKEECDLNIFLSINPISAETKNEKADHLSKVIGDLNRENKAIEKIYPCYEGIVNLKFVCDDPRLGKSKVISLPANKPIKKAKKKFSKVVGLEVEDLQFKVDGKDLDISLMAGQINGENIHVSLARKF